jgi:hypothetical protein
MAWTPRTVARWLLDSECGASDRLIARWLFLRALGLIYLSAFFSLIFQIRGLIGPEGIFPAGQYLQGVARNYSSARFIMAPTLLWFSTSSHVLMAICWVGLAASLLLTANVWPRGMLMVCFVCFLSFVHAAGEFANYQSDGMLLEAGFIALFFAPGGFLPGWGEKRWPSRASLFLLQFEWFRIYFESGVAKVMGGDPEWRHFTAMDEYYQNGPLPTWIGWYVQHLPHWFHATTVVLTLVVELGIVWMMFLPRRWRTVCFFIVTPWEIGVILTANYTFLNYLVLALGFLLLDDLFLVRFVPRRWRKPFLGQPRAMPTAEKIRGVPDPASVLRGIAPPQGAERAPGAAPKRDWLEEVRPHLHALKLSISAVLFAWIFYANAALLFWMFASSIPLPVSPVQVLARWRIANEYGLFGRMTRTQYEIDFQGSNDDGKTWRTYPFRFKPQDPAKAPGIYAPYQPRFDWNLWFASLGSWQADSIVTRTEERLLTNDADVLALFAGNPFPGEPPTQVRAMIWQYWFTSMAEKRAMGMWWRRQLLGLYAPVLARDATGNVGVIQWPASGPPEP